MLSRMRTAELMDSPHLDPGIHARALLGLERLNAISLSANLLWTQLKHFSAPKSSQTVRILDLATGGGDMPISLSRRAQTCGKNFEFVGADISPTAIDFAQLKAKKNNARVSFIKLDTLTDKLPKGFDVIITSLFTHHLDPPQVIDLFKKMRDAAPSLILVNDLVRSEVSLALVWLATRIFSRSAIVRHDGPASVRAAYTISEMKDMAAQAGLANCSVRFFPPCRQLLIWKRPL